MSAFPDKLDVDDAARLVRLLAEVGDPQVDIPILDRKRMLVAGLAEIIEADIWIWGTVVSSSADQPDDVMATRWIDGGWQDGEERAKFLGLMLNPEDTELMQGGILRKVLAQQIVTCTTEQIVDPGRRDEALQRIRVMEWSDSLVAGYPLGPSAFSGLGFHRRKPKPRYSERERLIVQLVVEQVDWLHRYGSNVPANEKVLRLTGRQRQVLMFLLSGDSQRQISLKMQVSEHTIGEHVKEIYRRFNVNSRGELFAHFVTGGQA